MAITDFFSKGQKDNEKKQKEYLKSVRENGMNLKDVPMESQTYDIVMEAVKENGMALQYVQINIPQMRTIIEVAVDQSPLAIQFVEDRFLNKALIEKALKDPRVYERASNIQFIVDSDYALSKLVLKNAPHLQYSDGLDYRAKAERENALEEVSRDGLSLARLNYKDDREVVLRAVRQNGMALQYVDSSLEMDKTIALEALSQNKEAYKFVSEDLIKSDKTVKERVKFAQNSIKEHNEKFNEVLRSVEKDALELRNVSVIEFSEEEMRKIVTKALDKNPNEMREINRVLIIIQDKYPEAFQDSRIMTLMEKWEREGEKRENAKLEKEQREIEELQKKEEKENERKAREREERAEALAAKEAKEKEEILAKKAKQREILERQREERAKAEAEKEAKEAKEIEEILKKEEKETRGRELLEIKVEKDWQELKNIPFADQTEEMIMLALQQNIMAYKYVDPIVLKTNPNINAYIKENLNDKEDKELKDGRAAITEINEIVAKDGMALQFVDNQSQQLVEIAVAQNPEAIKFANPEFVSARMLEEAVHENPKLIEVLYKNENLLNNWNIDILIRDAIEKDGLTLKFFMEYINTHKDSPLADRITEMCWAAIKENGMALQYVNKGMQNPNMCKTAVLQNPRAIGCVKGQPANVMTELNLIAVKEDGMALQYIENKSPRLIQLAVEGNGMALQFVEPKDMTEDIIEEAILQNADAIQFIPDNVKEKLSPQMLRKIENIEKSNEKDEEAERLEAAAELKGLREEYVVKKEKVNSNEKTIKGLELRIQRAKENIREINQVRGDIGIER